MLTVHVPRTRIRCCNNLTGETMTEITIPKIDDSRIGAPDAKYRVGQPKLRSEALKRWIPGACLCLVLAALGCTPSEPTQEDRDACLAAGHAPGSDAFQACLQERLAQRFERPAGDQIDTLRTRMGPRR